MITAGPWRHVALNMSDWIIISERRFQSAKHDVNDGEFISSALSRPLALIDGTTTLHSLLTWNETRPSTGRIHLHHLVISTIMAAFVIIIL